MKTTNQPPECECPDSAGHRVQITKAYGKYFMTAWSTFARRSGAVLRWISVFASPGVFPFPWPPVPWPVADELDLAVGRAFVRRFEAERLSENAFKNAQIARAEADRFDRMRFDAERAWDDADDAYKLALAKRANERAQTMTGVSDTLDSNGGAK